MTISKRQFTLLKEMGINIWQQKHHSSTQSNRSTNTLQANDSAKSNITITDLNALKNHPLFKDIIQSIGLSIGEITLEESYLNMGLLNWQFTADSELTLHNNLLTTPSLNILAKSSALKAKLWQLLQSQVLT